MSRYNRHIHARPGEHITVHRHDEDTSDCFLLELILWMAGILIFCYLLAHFGWFFLLLGIGALFSSK